MKINPVTRRNVWRLARSVWETEAASVGRLAQTIDPESLAACVAALAALKGRVLTTGCGTSAAAARKIAHSLCCIECPASFLAPGDALHGGLGLVQSSDIVIVVSKGGNTRELSNMLPSIKAKRARVIGVTENADSAVGKAADILLRVSVEREPDEFNMLATASTMAVVAVFDAICIALMKQTRFTRKQFAIIHPGGAVGERLLDNHKAHAG